MPPLVVRIANWGLLFGGRRYLLQSRGDFRWRESWTLLGDGIRYLSSSFSYVLVYQWPVYWIARVLPASESAPFAICMQVVVLSLSFTLGFLRPMWSSTADAQSRGDHAWLDGQMRRGRLTIFLAGVGVLATMLLVGQQMVRVWIRQPITMDWQIRGSDRCAHPIGHLGAVSLSTGAGPWAFEGGDDSDLPARGCLRPCRAAASRARRTQGAMVRNVLLHFVLDGVAIAKIAARTACPRLAESRVRHFYP